MAPETESTHHWNLPERPASAALVGRTLEQTPLSCRMVLEQSLAGTGEAYWVGEGEAAEMSAEERETYERAQTILAHLAVRAPCAHKSGHPGGALSAFTCAYMLAERRDPGRDHPLIISPAHLSVLAYGLHYVLGREGTDERLASPGAIIKNFRTLGGLPGHAEAGIGETPYGTGPLGKGPSNALGVALGHKLKGEEGAVDVLIGDGEAQEGQVHEMLRLAVQLKVDHLVMHMDCNNMQLYRRPTDTMSSDFTAIAHAAGWHVIEVENGNDPAQVRAAQGKAESLRGKGKPVFICYYTIMGHGVEVMEEGVNGVGENMRNYHGAPLSAMEEERALRELPDLDETVAAYAPVRQKLKEAYDRSGHVQTDVPLSWDLEELRGRGYKRAVKEGKGAARQDFGAVHLFNLMRVDPRIVVLHADIAGSGGFGAIEKEFPDRVINCGVAEANMYSMAAGLRQVGFLPVAYTFAPFAVNEGRSPIRLNDINCEHTRCGVLHDLTHAGTSVGEDGPTHQELNFANMPFPHTRVWNTADSNQGGAMAEKGLELVAEGHTNIFACFPRTGHPQLTRKEGTLLYGEDYVFDGKADLVRGQDDCSDQLTVLATGIPTHEAVAATDERGGGVRVLNIASIRPLDAAAVLKAALETGTLIVVEDHNIEGGLATQVSDLVATFGLPVKVRRLGVNGYQESAPADVLMHEVGFDRENIGQVIEAEFRAVDGRTEEQLVAVLRNLPRVMQDPNNRFAEAARPYVERLANDPTYLEELRALWRREVVMPESAEIRQRLAEMLSSKGSKPGHQ